MANPTPYGRAYSERDQRLLRSELLENRRKTYEAKDLRGSTRVWAQDFDAEYVKFNRVDPTSGPITVTLPIAKEQYGRVVAIKNWSSSSNNIIVTPTRGETIDGVADTDTISGAYTNTNYYSDGEGWIRG